MATAEKTQYENFAPQYDSVETLPCSQLEGDLIRTALGECTGHRILDLGGGSGIHARAAVDAGAGAVDVVDISGAMMQRGQDIEAKLGREDRIRWFEADVSRPLADPRVQPGQYDVVMANWVFDHATTLEELKGMWENIALYMKPGGKFLGVRVTGVTSPHTQDARYGAKWENITEISGGLRY